ncbi:CDT1-like protein b [Abrus precatorius]|uniref:CDT1-like protein b n=1 Tax=Abrus precatorius TaxID=3816 RepID=A0A8B8MG43_ABRPR|nr:CDT1-like protein b [Abrus precatorius]
MEKSFESPSPSCRGRSKKKLHLRSSEVESPDSVQLSSKTPEKKTLQRTRNRGVALSVAEIRKVAERLQDRKQCNDTTSSQVKSARRQISLPSPSKPKTTSDESLKLPEKYEILGEFFNNLDSSIRLLRLKGSMPSFTNISPKIECLTDRRFTHGHLAQMKFVLPEAIVIKKVLVFDERTSCMKPDLHVTINPDAVESDAKALPQCGSVSLRKLFRTRLRDFCKSHPEGDEIPEETLPEPFNHPKKDSILDMLKTRSSSLATGTLSDACEAHSPAILTPCMKNNDVANDAEPGSIEENLSVPITTSAELLYQQPAIASHVPQSFRRQFSQKCKANGADNVQQKSPLDSLPPLAFSVSVSSPKKNPSVDGTKSHLRAFPSKLASETTSSGRCIAMCASLESSNAPPCTPSKTIEHKENKDGSLESIDAMSTPAKFISTPSRLMTATPALPSPKRHYMSPNDNSTSSLNKLVRRPPRSRSLKFDSPVKNKETVNEDTAGALPIDDDVFEILPENLIKSIREKEKMAMEERDPAISQAKRRKKIIASLPKLFNMIHLLFHKRSVITKEELVSKIISNHCDIVDRSEVEEQMNLLQELVPEWISEKLASSGDFLVCINKMLNPETVRASLEEAK